MAAGFSVVASIVVSKWSLKASTCGASGRRVAAAVVCAASFLQGLRAATRFIQTLTAVRL